MASVQRQAGADIIVMASNNNSQDRTAAILDAWSTKINMTVVTQPALLGMWDHFNSLLERVATPYFMVLCHDDFLNAPDALAKAAHILDSEPAITAVYCDLAYVNTHGKPLMARRFRRTGLLPAELLGQQSLASGRNMFGIPLLVRTSCLGDKRYDARMTYISDIDLSWRISAGGLVHHVPEALIANRYSGYNTTWTVMRGAEREFRLLAQKRGIKLSNLQLLRLKALNWVVMQQRKIFGIYARIRTK